MFDLVTEGAPRFVVFGGVHLLMIALTLLIAFGLPFLAHRYMNARQQLWTARIITLITAVAVVWWILNRLYTGRFDPQTDLPLDICNLLALVLLALMWDPVSEKYEILYFWIFAGTSQAILTPHLLNGFPDANFLKYWTVHSGVFIYGVYITLVFRFYPNRESILKAFAGMLMYGLVLLVINLVLGSNYMYVLDKPPTPSLLDVLGAWPWYVFNGIYIAVCTFLLLYLPFELRLHRGGQGYSIMQIVREVWQKYR